MLLSLLRAIREEAGFSQKQLAAALGVDQTIVSKYEHGIRRMDLLELDAVCSIVGLPLEEFIRRYRSQADDATDARKSSAVPRRKSRQ